MPPFGVRRLNGNDVNSRVWTSTFRPNTAMGELAERYPAAIKIQAVLRGFIVRLRELNSMLIYNRPGVRVTQINGKSAWYDAQGYPDDFVPNLEYNGQSSRWLHTSQFNPNQLWNRIIYTTMGVHPTEPLAFNKFIQGRIRDRWENRRSSLEDWLWHRKRIGIKLLDFDRGTLPVSEAASTNPARRRRTHVPLRERDFVGVGSSRRRIS